MHQAEEGIRTGLVEGHGKGEVRRSARRGTLLHDPRADESRPTVLLYRCALRSSRKKHLRVNRGVFGCTARRPAGIESGDEVPRSAQGVLNGGLLGLNAPDEAHSVDLIALDLPGDRVPHPYL